MCVSSAVQMRQVERSTTNEEESFDTIVKKMSSFFLKINKPKEEHKS